MENINVPGAFAKNFKCPCCQNPWNQGDSLNNTTDTTFIACQPCLSDNKGFKGLDPSNFDPSVPVGENFFLWSNGGWKKNNPIPNEYSSWNTFIVLRDLNLERLKVILDDLLSATTSASSEVTDADIEKVKLFYAAFMNEEIIESNDAAPIFPILDLCGDIVKNPAKTIAALHSQYGVNGFFALGSMPDKANSELTIASLYQSGLGLPDRDYYFDADKKEKRSKYVEYIASLFDLLKDSLTKQSNSSISSPYVSQLKKLDSKTLAEKVLAFETELASHHLTRTACRDPNLTYNKLSFNDVIALSKQHTAEITWQHYLTYGIHPHVAFDWKDYFNLIGKSPEDLGDIINLQAKHYLVHLPKILNENADILPYYSIFHVLNSYAPHLSSRWVNAHFLFHEKELKGTSDLLVRWKRGLQALESALGEALGKLYVQRHFPTEYKQKALDVVYSVRDALQQRLTEIPWMSAETKTEAFLKMNKFKVKIGYPDHWKDYSHLNIYKDQHVANVIASRSFEFQVDLRRMNAPTDKARWFMTPQTVNAYFHPSLNEIVFPAAILQPPFFDAEADVAVQFGSLGAVVGHEMTHGYDDQGRKYDSNGNLRDWWTKADGEEYERRASVMVKQAEKFEVYGLKLNGKLTCGENIADLGGVKLALRALKNHLNSLSEPAPLINGLTPYQRFFLAWSQSWRENVKKERAIQLVTIDPHGPNELRCNGTLSNTTDFYEAFGITEKDRMFIPEAERVEIW